MKLTAKLLVASIALLAGCAARTSATQTAVRDGHEPLEIDQTTSNSEDTPNADEIGATEAGKKKRASIEGVSKDPRQVGDYVTYAFSGKYRKTALKLTQRVVARDSQKIVIDYAFTEDGKTETLRVALTTTPLNRGEVLEVARVAEDGSTTPATSADFETRIAATAAIADENEALLDQKQTTLRVGTLDFAATQSTYKVRVGKKSATLETTESETFAWGDLGGKITTSDGTIYFSAEIVDAGGPSSATASLQ